jgi:hypothetical protein
MTTGSLTSAAWMYLNSSHCIQQLLSSGSLCFFSADLAASTTVETMYFTVSLRYTLLNFLILSVCKLCSLLSNFAPRISLSLHIVHNTASSSMLPVGCPQFFILSIRTWTHLFLNREAAYC